MKISLKIEKALGQSRFRDRGLEHNPFNIEHINLWKRKVDRDNELIQAVEFLPDIAVGRIHNVGILGTHGIGKTMFLRLINDTFKKYSKAVDVNDIIFISNVSEFKEKLISDRLVTSEGRIIKVESAILAEIKASKNRVFCMLIDDLDIIFEDYAKQVIEIMQLPNVCVFGTWNISAWHRTKQRTDIKLPETEILYLTKLSNRECGEIITKRIKDVKLSPKADKLFSNKVINHLAKLSNGNPYRTIRLSKRLLNFMLENNHIKMDVGDDFDIFCRDITDSTVDHIKLKLKKLNSNQLQIIELLKNRVELTSSQIGDEINISRVGALKHLKKLASIGLIESRKKGKEKIYYLHEELEYNLD